MTKQEIKTRVQLTITNMGDPAIKFDIDHICQEMDKIRMQGRYPNKIIVERPRGCLIYGIQIEWG